MTDLIRREDAIKAIVNQTIYDNADEIKNECNAKSEKDTGFLGGIRVALEALEALPSAEPERRWIPVSEALPKNYEQTICIDSRGKMMIGMYGEYGWTFPCYMTEPVAWMPLPEAYRGE